MTGSISCQRVDRHPDRAEASTPGVAEHSNDVHTRAGIDCGFVRVGAVWYRDYVLKHVISPSKFMAVAFRYTRQIA